MPLIALLTDFGLADTYLAQMKSVILRRLPNADFLDLTHQIPPQDLWTAGYHLATALPWLPPHTVTMAVVDPGVGTQRRILLVQWEKQTVIAPDNGLLTQASLESIPRSCRMLRPDLPEFSDASPTFHGRDIFARIAARLADGETVETLSLPVDANDIVRLPIQPSRNQDTWQLRVLAIDHFGNIITNLKGIEFPVGSQIELAFKQRSITCPVTSTFAGVENQQLLAYSGSSGKLEFAIRNGNAALDLDLAAGDSLTVHKLP